MSNVAKKLTSAGPKFSDDKSRDGFAPPCKPLMVYFFGFFMSPVESIVISFNAVMSGINFARVVRPAGPIPMSARTSV